MFDLAVLSQDNSRWSVRMRTQTIQIKGRRPRGLKCGVAAGMLILTMSVAGATNDADSQLLTPGTQQTDTPGGQAKGKTAATTKSRVNKTLHWFQIGQASWYGLKFQGKKTANGESFDMNSLTCAHRSLPLGSWVRVTNLKNRQSVFVRVNDRGPVPENRVVDLSMAAARAVGLRGIGKVKLEPVRGNDPQMARELVAQLHMPLTAMAGQ
jgi:rare lipoprotein A